MCLQQRGAKLLTRIFVSAGTFFHVDVWRTIIANWFMNQSNIGAGFSLLYLTIPAEFAGLGTSAIR